MGIYMKKTKMGYRPYHDEDGRAAHNADGYYMDLEEYKDHIDSHRQEMNELRAAKYDAERHTSELCEEWVKEKANLEKQYQKRIADAVQRAEARCSEETAELKEELQGKTASLDSLLRIYRERANAKRRLTPKKQHCGYVILSSAETIEPTVGKPVFRPDLGIHIMGDVPVWVTRIQTPYPITYPIDVISPQIFTDLTKKNNIFGQMGICVPDGFPETDYREAIRACGSDANVLYRWRFSANTTVRLWEVDLYTAKAVPYPENLLPPEARKKTKTQWNAPGDEYQI